MKKPFLFRYSRVILICILCSLTFFSFRPGNSAVNNLFLSVPDSYFQNISRFAHLTSLSKKTRQKLLQYDKALAASSHITIDSSSHTNSHLIIHTTLDGEGCAVTLKIFGSYPQDFVVGICSDTWASEDLGSLLSFLNRKNGKWKDITKDIAPSVEWSDFAEQDSVAYYAPMAAQFSPLTLTNFSPDGDSMFVRIHLSGYEYHPENEKDDITGLSKRLKYKKLVFVWKEDRFILTQKYNE